MPRCTSTTAAGPTLSSWGATARPSAGSGIGNEPWRLLWAFRAAAIDGQLNLIANPIKHSLPDPEVTAPPLLGEHTEAVLTDLGCDPAKIEWLRAEGIV